MSGRQRNGRRSPDPHLKTAVNGTIFGTTIMRRFVPASQTENGLVLPEDELSLSRVESDIPDGPGRRSCFTGNGDTITSE